MNDWRNGRWVSIDLETTGIGPDDRIVEVGVCLMEQGKTLDAWQTFVNPGRSIPDDAISIHGIDDAMIVAAPTIQQLRIEITQRLAGADAIIAYNGLSADFPWLERELPGILPKGPVYVDPLVVVRKVLWGLKGSSTPQIRCPIWSHDSEGYIERSPKHVGRHSLNNVADFLGVFKDEPDAYTKLHRAEFDAKCAGAILWHLRNECNPNGVAFEAWERGEHKRQVQSLEKYWAGVKAADAAKRVARQTFEERLTAMVGEHFAALNARLDALTPVIPATHTMVQIDGLSEIRPLEWDALRAERDALAKRVKEAEERSAEWAARLGAKVNEGGA